MSVIGQFEKFLKFIKFQGHLKKNLLIWEKITKRLHHGLSETILVNTVTDIREFKKP